MDEGLAAGPMHLGDTTKGVRVLNFIAIFMGGQNLRACEKAVEIFTNGQLPGVGFQSGDLLMVGPIRPLEGIESKAGRHISELGQLLGLVEP